MTDAPVHPDRNDYMKRIKAILQDKRGLSTPLFVALILVFLLLICAASEYFRLITIAHGVRDALQSSVISVSTGNYDDTYPSLREGYSGGYTYFDEAWDESLDYGDIYDHLDGLLGLRQRGGWHSKDQGGGYEFRISSLNVEIINTPFTPGNTNDNFEADASVWLEVPLSFGWGHLPPLTMEVRTRAGYHPKF